MKQFMFVVPVIAVLLMTYGTRQVQAHGNEMHGNHQDGQMGKLHSMMPMFSQTIAKLAKAIEKSDASEVKMHVNKMLAAIPDLKKSKPHKNAKQIAAYRKLAGTFADEIASVGTLTEKGDFVGAKEAYKRVENSCKECHAHFSD